MTHYQGVNELVNSYSMSQKNYCPDCNEILITQSIPCPEGRMGCCVYHFVWTCKYCGAIRPCILCGEMHGDSNTLVYGGLCRHAEVKK